jgi:hypothetical protein
MIPADSAWQQRYNAAIEAFLQFIENENNEFKRQR